MKFIRNNLFLIISILRSYMSKIYTREQMSKFQYPICHKPPGGLYAFWLERTHRYWYFLPNGWITFVPTHRARKISPNRRKSQDHGITYPIRLSFFSALSTKFMFLFRKLRIPEKTYMTADLGHSSLLRLLYRIWFRSICRFSHADYPFDRD